MPPLSFLNLHYSADNSAVDRTGGTAEISHRRKKNSTQFRETSSSRLLLRIATILHCGMKSSFRRSTKSNSVTATGGRPL